MGRIAPWRALGGLALGALSSIACAAPRGLTVDVRTDYLPGTEFVSVQVEVAASRFVSPAAMGQVSQTAAADTDYVRGVQVAERTDLAPGTWYVRVSLLDAAAHALAQRTTIVTVAQRTSLSVVIARTCNGVVCGMLDPALTECHGGRCVDPHCSAGDIEACGGAVCRTAADCTPPGACASAVCAGGACLFRPDDAACVAGLRCAPDYRCVAASDGGTADAGSGPADVGTSDAGACAATETACADGRDDDCDGRLDCADGDCLGAACGPVSGCTGFGPCNAAGICDLVGAESQDCTHPLCSAAGSCDGVVQHESRACARATEGVPCGGTSCGDWACTFGSFCSQLGGEERTCSFAVCASGVCAPGTRIESGSNCNRVTDGMCCDHGYDCLAGSCTHAVAPACP